MGDDRCQSGDYLKELERITTMVRRNVGGLACSFAWVLCVRVHVVRSLTALFLFAIGSRALLFSFSQT